MQRLRFSKEIKAPREKIWKVLWDDATFRDWTSVFAEGSHAVSDWKEGSQIQFIDPNANAGMSSRIDKLVPNELMLFRHLTEIKDGREQPPPAWSGMTESYTLTEDDGATRLVVEMDVPDEFRELSEKLPTALDRVKALAENK